MVSESEAKNLWRPLFCTYFGKIRPYDWDTFHCQGCLEKVVCRVRFTDSVVALTKEYGSLDNVPDERLKSLGFFPDRKKCSS